MAKLKVDYRNRQEGKIGDTREKVLICGIPGVGKTVLAKCVYNKLNHLYDACCFLEKCQQEISDDNIVSVQSKLISRLQKGNAQKFDCSDEVLTHIQSRLCTMKVLVLLDDVKDCKQLIDLVGEPDWFGPGSTVIVTSQRHDVLEKFKDAPSYVLRTMKQDEALELFCWHAFEKASPLEKFKELATKIVAAIDGLPLGLEEVGKFLSRKSKSMWTEKLIELTEAPDKVVHEAFFKSYTTLDEKEKNIFLDIACFCNGKDMRIPYYMWRDLEFSPSLSIPSLNAMSLVEIGEDKELCMHGILKKFGREIVKKENRKEPFNRSRLWDHDEALRVLRGRLGSEKVEALGLEFADRSEENRSFESDRFDGLQKLRFLKLDQANIQGNFCDRFLSLKWLDWQGCTNSIDLQLLNLNLRELVILDLSGSQVDKDWGGWELLKQTRKLKVLKLTGCVQLTATPEFPASMELERLILEGCSNLAVIDSSFCNLTMLVSLNMKGCSLLRELPDLGPMRGLKELVIDGTSISQINFQEGSLTMLKTLSARDCKDLTDISDSIWHLKSLKYLTLDGSEISTLPESIGSLEKLKTLSVKNCGSLSNLPDGIGKLQSLQFLDLSDTAIQKLPPSFKDLKDRKVLRMIGISIQEFPEAILNLEKLEEIDHQVPLPPTRKHSNFLGSKVCDDEAPSFVSLTSATQKMGISHITDHSSSMSERPDYEVFLSFRGPDTRRHFADFLYIMLKDVEIGVFRDEEDLEKGKEINPKLMSAIMQSKISIPVISKEYGSSKSCLMELKQMVECMDNNNHIIIPIFYHVEPSDVRNCRGPFEGALDGHKKRGRDGGVLNHWMSALRRIGYLKGYHLHEKSDGYHGKVIKQIVREVELKLKKRDLIVPKHLVGVDHHVQEIMAKLKVDYRNGQAVKIGDTPEKVLICGIPGVGKTVLAKCVYNKLNHLFDACSFLEELQKEISDDNIVSVQNRLISQLHRGNAQKFDCSDEALIHIKNRLCYMRVLVLLDDVKDREQLTALVGELDWLGPGSRVILTSRRQDVLRNINGVESFFLKPMRQDEALELFCKHAFQTDSPREKFRNLSTDIVAATGRLPLALEAVGSSLFLAKSKEAWRETLNALKVAPQEKVKAAFEMSYNNLDDDQQQIFLDIACFFIGMDRRIPSYMWNDCNYSPSRSIEALQAMSFVEIGEDNELRMHEMLKMFGREIVKKENQSEPCKRSRLCDYEDALHVLRGKMGIEKVEALGLEFGDGSEGNISFECDQFDGLQNLRYLKLDRADICGNFGDRLSSLRWLDWRGCPKIFDIQSLNLNLQNLVILDLSGSQVDKDWGGWELLKQARKLKVLKLMGCVQLTATPEFPASMELEMLILEGCSNLAVIDPSFCNLTKLISLNIKGCSLLRELPNLGLMRDLKELVIGGTSISRINF